MTTCGPSLSPEPGDGEDLDDHLRVEVGVDLLACRAPTPRIIIGDRRRRTWVARGRSRRHGDEPLDVLIELAYLARSLRPRWLALGVVIRPEEMTDPPRLALHVVTARRTLAGCVVGHREHPFTLIDDLPAWDPAEVSPAPSTLALTAQTVLRRVPRRRRRAPHLVMAHLTEQGHHIGLAPGRLGHVEGPRRAIP